MPSIFSRSRTTSTPYPQPPDSPLDAADEFGRVSSRQSNHKGSGGAGLFSASTKTTKKEKKKVAAKEAQLTRLRTMSGVASPVLGMGSPVDTAEILNGEGGVFEYAGVFVQDGSFFPTILEKPILDSSNGASPALDRSLNSSYSSTFSSSSSSSFSSPSNITMDFPYLTYQRHVILSVDAVSRLVDVVCEELGTRGGITTPFIFSTLALDISPTPIRRLIDTFLATCASTQSTGREKTIAEKELASHKWREETRFAGMHELGMTLRWALARVVRVSGGQECRGLFSYEWYAQWRDEEEALLYPPTHFTALLPSLSTPVREILLTVLSLLARLTANSATSGHTPPTLSSLFGPLLFGLGPPSLPFHHTYIFYLRSVSALEHILLAFIRWQDTPRTSANSPNLLGQGSQTTLGVPKKLKEWIKGYPATLHHLHPSSLSRKQQEVRPEPRKGARTIRVLSVKRNVRSYEKDLVKNSASWSKRAGFLHGQPQASQTSLTGGLEASKEWERVAPLTRKGSGDRQPPKYSEAYKKRMNLPSSINPDLGLGVSSISREAEFVYGLSPLSLNNPNGNPATGTKGYSGGGGLGLGNSPGEDRFKSLTDLKWGEFESLGFGGLGTGGAGDKKLEFDLTEGARNARTTKRQTLGWDDFSTAGFSRNDEPLSTTLQFSSPINATIESWPKEREEIGKKLKKREKALPPFGWDTSPVVGGEEVIEEAFVDVFCDLIWGSGWGEGLAGLSGLRNEGVLTKDGLKIQLEDRECNWALVEFKSLPTSRSLPDRPSHYPKPVTGDPRTGVTLVLFEEFVPLEYRQQLALLVTGNRKRLPSFLTSPSKKNQWKPAATLNGRPYVVGHVPSSPNYYREMEFEGLLRGEGKETRVLSLSTSVKLPAPKVIRPPENPPPLPPQQHQQSPLPAPPPERTTAASEELHSDSTLQSVSNISQNKRKFKLPVSPAVGVRSKSSGLPPAEYSSVDFETRLRGYSDDSNSVDGSSLDEYGGPDENEEKKKKRERRTSRRPPEEAWVDILVGTQERRMAGQDAAMRSRDPEAASLEVQQALAAVQNHRREFSPSDDEDDTAEKEKEMKKILHEHRPYGDLDEDEDLDEIETVPRRERTIRDSYASTADYTDDSYLEHNGEPNDEECDEEEPKSTSPKKKLGYFDLHPDRRPPSVVDDDPRTMAMQKYDESDEEDGGGGSSYATPVTATPALATAATTPHGHVRPLPIVPAPQTTTSDEAKPSSISQATLKPLPSKTAALIEMYREKEKVSPTPGAGGAPNVPTPSTSSKIPVRTGAGRSELPIPPAVSPPSPPQQNNNPQTLVEPPKLTEDAGRASPGRYIHGAPLHNVLEEEEE
ncbi:hypothetical protein E1B28_013273 [Marasmius oreades]|uniref:Meiotically up-regulated protein Msb1/Mug8 domain-containing protein n=1 Tax=Marasmius oreades TaxID=181124 RepID=A0A9P7RQ81_9AGAR|nr:uncharacterized protein E1B28_013273 [Marasmius oreades]KAG7087295.1 hypothetical protein E1B28_013273 [Marasmius oreades]